MVTFQVKCSRCKKNYVKASSRFQYGIVCFECQEKDMQGDIKDPEMQKMFNIPNELYVESSFLRSIKINYLKFGQLSERQVEAFKSTVDKMSKTQVKSKAELELSQIPEAPTSMRAERLAKAEAKKKKKMKEEGL